MMWRIKNRKKEKKRKLNLIIRFTHTHILTLAIAQQAMNHFIKLLCIYIKAVWIKKWQYKRERAKKR